MTESPWWLLRAAVFLAGVVLVVSALLSAVRTFVLPRSARDPITRFVFRSLRRLFDLRLGFVSGEALPLALLNFSEAAIGLLLLALLISYLPTMYATFSRRETAVTLLDVRAGSPPSAIEMLERYHRLGRAHRLNHLWVTLESLFAGLEESHTSLAALGFFRSPNPAR